MASTRRMTFQRFGRSRHLKIATAGDLSQLLELDEAHWLATGAPRDTLNGDATFLALIDSDNNGRIMCFELTEAIRWLLRVLGDTSGVTGGATSLPLAAINTDDAEGRRIYSSAGKILDRLGVDTSAETPTVTLEQVRGIKASVESTPVSEAGVVLPKAAGDQSVSEFISDIVATVGGAPHPSGSGGVGEAQLEDFLTQAKAYVQWRTPGDIPPEKTETAIMPLGARTPQAYALYAGLRTKIDQYFAQCEAAALDPRTAGRIGVSDADLQQLDLTAPEAIEEFIRNAPLATPNGEGVLSFEDRINPYYLPRLEQLRDEVLEPALGHSAATLTGRDWRRVKELLSAHEGWLAAKAGQAVEKLGSDKLTEYLDPTYRSAVEALIAERTETALVLDNIRLLEKLLLYQAHMVTLANNFVSFPHLYDPKSRAMFEMGTLVMDGRLFTFSIRAGNRAKHSKIAASGSMFVLYVEVAGLAEGDKLTLAVAVASGGKGNLCVGKRGVFHDVFGRELDAEVVQIVENPISIGEAVVSPFRRLGRLLSGKIEAITTSAEKEFDAKASRALDTSTQADAAPKAPATNKGLMAGGLLMGGGVALAAVGSAVTYTANTFRDVSGWKIALGVALAVLAVVLPVSILGLLKLRRRNLSALLEGSGWAVNAPMHLTLSQGRTFTRRPRYPTGSRGVWSPLLWLLPAGAVVGCAGLLAWYLLTR